MQTAQPQQPAWQWRHFAALILGNAALALGPWAVRLADSGPVAAGFWRLTLALPLLLVLTAVNRQKLFSLPPRVLRALVLGGVLFAADLATWHIGIPRTRLANATLFGNCSSLILMAWGLAISRRWPHRGEWAALVATIAGASILFGRSLQLSANTLSGDLFCVTAGIFYVFYLVLLQGARGEGEGVGNWAALTVASLAAAPPLLITSLAMGEPFWPGATHLGAGLGTAMHGGWLPLIALALGSQIIGQGLLVYALRHFTPVIVGLALLTQPAVASVVGWLAYGERLTGWDGVGIALVASALVLARMESAPAPAD